MNSCASCNGACCKYVSVRMPAPVCRADFDEIMWFVSHENVLVYKDCDNDWLVEFKSMCKFLKNDLCENYDNRPKVCRDYDPKDCTHISTDDAKIILAEPADVERYVAKRWPKKSKSKR